MTYKSASFRCSAAALVGLGVISNGVTASDQQAMSPAQAVAAALQSRISDMGPDGDEKYDALRPAVAYNPDTNECLVAWEGDDNVDGPAPGEFEIRAQIIDAATGEATATEDMRVSYMGAEGDPQFGAFHPSVAYNFTDKEYFVVWQGDDDLAGLADDEFEIYGQRLDLAGMAIGGAVRISSMGPDGDPAFVARNPHVVFNGLSNEFFVVWEGTDSVADEFEIYGQRLDRHGQQVGEDDFRISDMGPEGDPAYDAFEAAVTYNSVTNEYLVVWEADDDTEGLVAGEFEIFGQRLDSTGLEIGQNDYRISVTNVDGDGAFDAVEPAIVFNRLDNEYLVVWVSDALVEDKFEVWAQFLDGATGRPIGGAGTLVGTMGDPGDNDLDADAPQVAFDLFTNTYLVVWHGDDQTGDLDDGEFEIYGRIVPLVGDKFRLSDMGTNDGDLEFDARWAAAVWNENDEEFLVVWEGDDGTGEQVNDEYEIYGQRVSIDGIEAGVNDFRISTAGPDGDLAYDAASVAVAYNSVENEYLVVWEGDDNIPPLVDGEQEIFGQRIDAATGAEVGVNDFRISDMGPDGDPNFEAGEPRVAYNSIDNVYLVIWEGDDDTGDLVDGEFEVWGQLIDGATGEEIGEDFRISDAGPDGLDSRDAGPAAVAWGSITNTFLVVFEADDTEAGIPNHKLEIFGQFLDGATGQEVGVNDFRLSTMGPNDDPEYDAREVAIAFNSVSNEFLVVWRGEDDTGGLVFDEFEIFGQRVDALTGQEVGPDDFRISDMGSLDGDINYDANTPAVAHDPETNRYLVVWSGDDDSAGLADDEFEIFGQLLDGVTGEEIGVNDFRISDMGPDGDSTFATSEPWVVYNLVANEYLVVWEANDDRQGLSPGEVEIFAQRISPSGVAIGPNDRRVSQMGVDGEDGPRGEDPAIAFGTAPRQYLVAWNGDPAAGELINNEHEIFIARLTGVYCSYLNLSELLELASQWGTEPSDRRGLDGNEEVDASDFWHLLHQWWQCP